MWVLILLGKILLWLLIIFFVLVLLILFWPIRYRLKGSFYEKKPEFALRISWLCGFLRICFDYPKDKEPKIRLLFFTLRKKQDRRKAKKKSTSRKNTEHTDVSQQEINTTLLDPDKNDAAGVRPDNVVVDSKEASENISINGSASGQMQKENANASSETPSEDGEGFFSKCKAKIQKLRYTIQSLYDKITHIREEYAFYRGLWDEPVLRGYMVDAFFLIWKVIKKLLPQKVKVSACIGTGACDSTGYLMGIYGIVSSLLPKKYQLYLEPDFEQRIAEGNVYICGNISLIVVIAAGVRLIFDKRLRVLRNKIKKHMAENKHVQNGTGME